ncbi:MAG: double-strand break repair protein AddB [Ascidiaceihabitans sp.]|uniref:double-strand break repair protein AddB n=1 Tax=Ascidiaceihabitans sp. TaxID=1872644 RepID=UPI0032968025
MFDPSPTPRVFGAAPGLDFPKALVDGLTERMKGRPPEDMARVDVIVNTRRMARRMRDLFDQGPALLLPRIRLLTDLAGFAPDIKIPPSMPPLRRRLELIRLISELLDRQPELAPRASLYGLADSLAALLDEMQGEGVSAETIAALDVTDQSGHWARAQSFINIAQTYVSFSRSEPDPEARQRMTVEGLQTHWAATPPTHPVILAGSTGSRGTTLMLMKAIAALPQGAVILPGFDFDMPAPVWSALSDAMTAEDHPQFRFHKLLAALDMGRRDVKSWTTETPYAPHRNALVSLALRPAPVTDAWLDEGPDLQDLMGATADITLVQTETPRDEALAIAMRLREAAETNQTAALITPDRLLTRQVAAALDRWNILPDDSAGAPLHLSAPGRFLRHVAGLFVRPLDAEALLTILKHPLCHSTDTRGQHQLNTQRLELRIRRDGLPYPTPETLIALAAKVAEKRDDAEAFMDWAAWVANTICGVHVGVDQPLVDWVTQIETLAENIAGGPQPHDHELWKKKAGQLARSVLDVLAANAEYGSEMSASDFADLLGALLAAEEVRDRDAPHPGIMIWGTLEARVQGADLVILSGLNEGTWPEAPKPDPWLNRAMRFDAGLLLPERRIGLSAHDFQQAIAAKEVWITRAVRSDDAETVPSRWLNRIQNLLGGLPEQNGPDALKSMMARGDIWLAKVKALETVVPSPKADRPSPRPPKAARPHRLSVTEIKRLIRDPYAVYAKHTLELRPLNPIVQSPDAPLRGILIHEVMEHFVEDIGKDPTLLTAAHLMQTAGRILSENVPWPAARTLWLARLGRVADWFVAQEHIRQLAGTPIAFEKEAHGVLELADIGFSLIGFADRIDARPDGSVVVYDYKTGKPPTAPQQAKFEKQLLLEAAMLEEGAFKHIGPRPVHDAVFIGLGSSPAEVRAPLTKEPAPKVIAELRDLITAYLSPDQGFTSKRMEMSDREVGDYDQLARFGEWDSTDAPAPEDLT